VDVKPVDERMVLVVDDDPGIRESMSDLLHTKGYSARSRRCPARLSGGGSFRKLTNSTTSCIWCGIRCETPRVAENEGLKRFAATIDGRR
jgi:CheY-like chemotaxis protein